MSFSPLRSTAFLLPAFLLAVTFLSGRAAAQSAPELWYAQPAGNWNEALPVGNGRLGAMVFGGTEVAHLQLNEDSVWAGQPQPDWRKGSPADIARWREQLARGEVVAVDREVMPKLSAGSIKRSHQTLGDLHVAFVGASAAGEVSGYRRNLDLRDGIAAAQWRRGGVTYRQQVLCSAPHQALVVRLEAGRDGALGFDLRLSRPEDGGRPTVSVDTDEFGALTMRGRVTQRSQGWHAEGDGLELQASVAVQVEGGQVGGGAVDWGRDSLRVRGARAATVWLVGRTAFHGPDLDAMVQRDLQKARSAGWDQVRASHVADHRALFDRVALRLGDDPRAADVPTDQRLQAVAQGGDDPALAALLFQYGRYLLMGCSRPGTLPANLQGLWNQHIEAPWNADYHLNINLQMNYWPAEVTGLSELHMPLFDFLERLAERGRGRAQETFGMRGYVSGHATDVWAPAFHRSAQPYWGFWHMGAAWLCQHVMEHWRFGGDDAWMKQKGWPLLKGQARFFLDWLVEDPATGELVSGPSTSPENSYRLPSGERVAVCMGPAMDQQIIAEVFGNCLEVATALDLDDDITIEIVQALAKLRDGVQIGSDGRILEWDQEVEEVEPGHRHMSHLYALHPGQRIDPVLTPELAAAARETIEGRLAHGGGGTGWSRAWLISFAARLHDGAQAHDHLLVLLRRSMAPNLFDLHPPFQIDGNFGATAGIAEMLLQSTLGIIEILPALPAAWSEGSFRGLRARGGFGVDCRWDQGAWRELTIRSRLGRELLLRSDVPVRLAAEEGWSTLQPDAAGLIRVPTQAGEVCRFRPQG